MKRLTRRHFVAGAAAAVTVAQASRTEAQSAWPAKPIRVVVPYPPGGQTDGVARVFSESLTRQLGKPVIVENKAGGGGVIGVTEVKRAAPDGYTILYTISSSLIQNRLTIKDLPYNPEKDFIYLSMIRSIGGPVIAAKKTGATNLAEFIAYAKKVGRINWGSYGVGSTPHILIETIAKQYGIEFEAIQYRGEAPMFADIAGQTLDGAAGSYSAAVPVIQSGQGVLIGMMGDRLSSHPDTPTMIEQGAVGDFYDTRAFSTFAVPTGTPNEIVERLSVAVRQAGTEPKIQNVLGNYQLNAPNDFAETNRRFKRDSEVMLDILRGLGVKPDQ